MLNSDFRNKQFAFVIASSDLGGAERQAILLAKELQNRISRKVIFICFGNRNGSIYKYLNGFKIIQIEEINSPSKFKRILSIVKFVFILYKYRVKILLPYTYIPNFYSCLFFRFAKVEKCIWNQRDEGKGNPKVFLNKIAVNFSNHFVSNSIGGKDFLTNSLNVVPSKISIIPNGFESVKPSLDKLEWRKLFNFDKSDVLICMLANITKFKDHETLLKSWKIVNNNGFPGCKLLLAGKFGDNYEHIKSLVLEFALEDSVFFLGHVEDVPNMLNSVDISILSSHSEGMSNSIMESMALGLPVLGTDIPGINDLVCEDSRRYLNPKFDYEFMAKSISEFITNKELRIEIGEQNRRRIISTYSKETLFENYYKLISQLYEK